MQDRIGSAWPSPWEDAWLTVDRLASRGELRSGVRPDAFGTTSMLGAATIAILCLDSAGAGLDLVRALAADEACTDVDRAWLAWLGGDDDVSLAENLDDDVIGYSPERSLAAALREDWADAEARLPKAMRKPQSRAIKPSGRMHGHFIAQLAQHVQTGSPTREIVDASLAVLFHHYGFDAHSPRWLPRSATGSRSRSARPRTSTRSCSHRGRSLSARPPMVRPRSCIR